MPIAIPSGANLNSYTAPGFYYCNSNATAATLLNAPEARAFALLVERNQVFGSGNGVHQTYKEYSSSRIYSRAQNIDGGAWTAWKRYLVDGDIVLPTPQSMFPTQGIAADIGWLFGMTTGGWNNYRHATIASVRASMGIPGRIIYSANEPAYEAGAIWLKPI